MLEFGGEIGLYFRGTISMEYNRKGNFPSLSNLLLVSFTAMNQLFGSEIDQKEVSSWGKEDSEEASLNASPPCLQSSPSCKLAG